MAQACTVSHAENKRSLPAWMLKACSGNQEAKPEDQNKQTLESDEQIGALDQTRPNKRNIRKPLKRLNSEGDDDLLVLRQCDGSVKAKRKSKDAVKVEVKKIEEPTSKNAIKASGKPAPKNTRKRKLENVKTETSSPGTTDDEIELTVEDLVSIAEEYVNADKQKQHELDTAKTVRHKEHLLCPTILTEANKGGSVGNAQPTIGSMQCTTVTTNTRPSEHRGDRNKSVQELQCLSSTETTEDVAQDMLNLFFGSLLSKPAGYTKKSEPIELTTRTMDHVPEKKDWPSEVPSPRGAVEKTRPIESMSTTVYHVPEKKDWRSEVPRHGEFVTKKKSSLRDKVALFL